MHNRTRVVGTGGTASNKRHSSSHAVGHTSNEDYIKQLQAEIERLKADSAKGSKYQRQQQ